MSGGTADHLSVEGDTAMNRYGVVQRRTEMSDGIAGHMSVGGDTECY
jgi:hypothetical protein